MKAGAVDDDDAVAVDRSAVWMVALGIEVDTELDSAGSEEASEGSCSCLELRVAAAMPGWRGCLGYLPLREGKMRQSAWLASQLLHGCFSITSQRTRRRLHPLQACLARDLLWFPFMLPTLLVAEPLF